MKGTQHLQNAIHKIQEEVKVFAKFKQFLTLEHEKDALSDFEHIEYFIQEK